MTASTDPHQLSVDVQTGWIPFLVDGRQAGEVCWLVAPGSGAPITGLWRIDPQSGAQLPYTVRGVETFHVLEGEAVLEQADGSTINLVPGTVISLPDGFEATWRTISAFKKFFVIA